MLADPVVAAFRRDGGSLADLLGPAAEVAPYVDLARLPAGDADPGALSDAVARVLALDRWLRQQTRATVCPSSYPKGSHAVASRAG
jgi:hypothetical protein